MVTAVDADVGAREDDDVGGCEVDRVCERSLDFEVVDCGDKDEEAGAIVGLDAVQGAYHRVSSIWAVL